MGTEVWNIFANQGSSTSITLWYKRHECGLRMSIFFSAATAAGAFGGLLARGIVEMKGVAGFNGWRWIFILEGLFTIVIGKSGGDGDRRARGSS